MFKAGDKVIVEYIDPAIHPIAYGNGLRVGQIRTLRLSSMGRVVIPFTNDLGSLGMGLKAGLKIKLYDSELGVPYERKEVTRNENADDEGERMLRFFKSSSHDPSATW